MAQKVIKPKKMTFESKLKIENALRKTKFGKEQDAKKPEFKLTAAQLGSVKKDLQSREGVNRLKERFKEKYGIILTAKDIESLRRAVKRAKEPLSKAIGTVLSGKKLGGKVHGSRQTTQRKS